MEWDFCTNLKIKKVYFCNCFVQLDFIHRSIYPPPLRCLLLRLRKQRVAFQFFFVFLFRVSLGTSVLLLSTALTGFFLTAADDHLALTVTCY